MASPLFIVTDAGLAAASQASPTGPHINITGFIVGDAYGYEATRKDTWLRGNLLYGPSPAMGYRNVGNNTMDIICRIPPDAGPFEYGEIGILVEDKDGNEVLFAKAVFDTPQLKYTSLGTNISSSDTFHCLIKLEQSIAVFNINTICQQAIFELDRWSDIQPAGVAAYGDVPSLIVRELDSEQRSTLLTYSNDLKWSIATNYLYGRWAARVQNSSVTWVDLPVASMPNNLASDTQRQYVLEFPDGTFRSAASCVRNGNTYRFNLNPAPLPEPWRVGTTVIVHTNLEPRATRDFVGVVKIGPTLDIGTDGKLDAPYATRDRHGIVRIGDNIAVENGVIRVPVATSNNLGVVRVGTNINVSNGTISVSNASNSTRGVVTLSQIQSMIDAGISAIPEPGDGSIAISPDPGNLLTLRPNGYGAWFDSPEILASGPGWMKLLGGPLFQWGQVTLAPGLSVINLPVAYESSYSVMISIGTYNIAGSRPIGAEPVNNGTFRANNSGSLIYGCYWMAIGY